jgi:hypothetical protein
MLQIPRRQSPSVIKTPACQWAEISEEWVSVRSLCTYMSFLDAEKADPSLGGVPAMLRTALTEAGYTRNQHQIYDNMDLDPLIGHLPEAGKPACRTELLKIAAGFRIDATGMRNAAVDFCREHQQEGPSFPEAHNSGFGRVAGFRSLVNVIAASDRSLSLRAAEALLHDVIHDAPVATRLQRQQSALAGRTLARFQMWCYPAGDQGNPFAEIGNTRDEAVNVLGLGYYAYNAPGDELVRWAHRLPGELDAHRPTAWDAGASSAACVYWRPGGRTYRLDRDACGLDEVVHPPIKGESLTAAINPIP